MSVRYNQEGFNVRDFGARGDGVTDDAPAFQAAINATIGGPVENYARGRKLFIPKGDYWLGETIFVRRQMYITGETGTGFFSATKLYPRKNKSCIQVDFENLVDAPEARGSSSVVENLHIIYPGFSPYARFVWKPSHAYSVGDMVTSSNGPSKSHYYTMECTGAGTTDTTEPDWDATPSLSNGQGPLTLAEGATVTDGTVEWTVRVIAGIRCHVSSRYKNIYVENCYGNGALFAASVSWNPYANVNGVMATDITVTNCLLNGVYIDGPDANACQFMNLSAITCRRWGVYDSSFLGNTHISHHAADNGCQNSIEAMDRTSGIVTIETETPHHLSVGSYIEVLQSDGNFTNGFKTVETVPSDTTFTYTEAGIDAVNTLTGNHYILVDGGAYKADDLNAASIWLGCYSEGGQLPSEVAAPSMMYGGLHGAGFNDTATGTRFMGNGVESPGFLWRDVRSTNTKGIYMRMPYGGDYAMQFGSTLSNTSFSFGDNGPTGFTGWWCWRESNLDARMFMAWSGQTSSEGPGYIWFPSGVRVGTGAQHITTRGTKPSAGAATLPLYGSGSLFLNWNQIPQVGGDFAHGILGWQVTYQDATSPTVQTLRWPHFGFINQIDITNGVGSPYTLLPFDHAGATFTNTGATAKVYANLNTSNGFPDTRTTEYAFYVTDADGMRITAQGSYKIRYGNLVTASNGYLESTNVGSWLKVKLLGSSGASSQEWVVTEIGGLWTDGTSNFGPTATDTVIDRTADLTLTAANVGITYTNSGASALVTLTLPAAVAGMRYRFVCIDADGLKIQAVGSDLIYHGTSVSSAAGSLSSNTIVSTVELVALSGGRWVTFAPTGLWATA